MTSAGHEIVFSEIRTQVHHCFQHAPNSPIQMVRRFAQKFFENTRGSHDWDHSLRVCNLCESIGRTEHADMDVLRIAAYLHDIGRCYQDASNGAVCHARLGTRIAAVVLEVLPLTTGQKENILHCIQTHRFRGNNVPLTIEAKILFDADKLDAIGAVGIARAYLFAGELGARLHNPDVDIFNTKAYSQDDTGYREYKVKLCKIRDRIMTPEGRRLAEERHAFMEAFFQRFLDEYQGKG